ncbi:NADP-dependent isocitrate dehydrogenase [Desulfovibrio litoralis]|uniref:isocitrate dehydrogenase (NADP(+)) n=1 Tax=Desulfovibrio litoralis DSM 11393 TaxID=1121455 RepID=A0A1M7SB95_9BACT|nr:NADP-dependent isocitrate dehydrogenase [Desulfovibrio litoralis]SHN55807.1 isocitrate dehydrogenase (NADP) [Desulfovibrio litoralis DSM 11393]
MQKTIYFIEGDGIGPEVSHAGKNVLNNAVKKAYSGKKSLEWKELLAGEKALKETGELLPEATLNALKNAELAIKGPLGTPVGKGFRSLNVTLRQTLDLYACIRPIRWFKGIESPLKRPDLVDMVIFRENTEDVYAGIEYEANSPEAKKLIDFLRSEFGAKIDASAAIGIKPMTQKGSGRLVKKAIEFALAQNKPSVTLMHKGNIMKFTEGGFRAWGYEVAKEFGDKCCTEDNKVAGKLIIKDRIADALFQDVLIKPEQYSVIATPNLNGDYISDALAAQVGGLGMAPGVNMSEKLAFYEATHGTAPAIAGKDKANPSSFILSGAMMLEHIGWNEAAQLIYNAINQALEEKTVTEDLAGQMQGAKTVGCKAFSELLQAKF